MILVSRDGDFKPNCKREFIEKWERYITIETDENAVLTELKRDYENYIDNRKVYDYAQKEYFADYLKDRLTPASSVQVDSEDLPIQNYTIREICQSVEVAKNEDGDFEQPVIVSNVVINTVRNGKKIDVSVIAKTTLSDFETMEISDTTFNPIII